ncbi:hypothetical protein AMAG_14739 [Allomyces macrogynus ATCC 38327]|uniref:Uncharacterized protein n=1 Tax=Allomyces macrogynus (strain ATCC 38327) TaxID=578462 RepID=A0A0L0T512_ALLM3|nr:hypothetical protein AMAG_14739 [Allomyces macrogynus ATCC 38327]|eukprot:KNE69893.1 hypothetical protein AMAG_14739 [Allomyces macrogynus ATCC 38327]
MSHESGWGQPRGRLESSLDLNSRSAVGDDDHFVQVPLPDRNSWPWLQLGATTTISTSRLNLRLLSNKQLKAAEIAWILHRRWQGVHDAASAKSVFSLDNAALFDETPSSNGLQPVFQIDMMAMMTYLFNQASEVDDPLGRVVSQLRELCLIRESAAQELSDHRSLTDLRFPISSKYLSRSWDAIQSPVKDQTAPLWPYEAYLLMLRCMQAIMGDRGLSLKGYSIDYRAVLVTDSSYGFISSAHETDKDVCRIVHRPLEFDRDDPGQREDALRNTSIFHIVQYLPRDEVGSRVFAETPHQTFIVGVYTSDNTAALQRLSNREELRWVERTNAAITRPTVPPSTLRMVVPQSDRLPAAPYMCLYDPPQDPRELPNWLGELAPGEERWGQPSFPPAAGLGKTPLRVYLDPDHLNEFDTIGHDLYDEDE